MFAAIMHAIWISTDSLTSRNVSSPGLPFALRSSLTGITDRIGTLRRYDNVLAETTDRQCRTCFAACTDVSRELYGWSCINSRTASTPNASRPKLTNSIALQNHTKVLQRFIRFLGFSSHCRSSSSAYQLRRIQRVRMPYIFISRRWIIGSGKHGNGSRRTYLSWLNRLISVWRRNGQVYSSENSRVDELLYETIKPMTRSTNHGARPTRSVSLSRNLMRFLSKWNWTICTLAAGAELYVSLDRFALPSLTSLNLV